MECNFHGLPPHKRFRLTQKQEEHQNPVTAETIPTHSSLPAKKRKLIREDHSHCPPFPPNSNSNTPFCLPAKKRILAFQPFDLNLEYQSPSEIGENENDGEDNDDDGIVCAVCGSTDGDPTDPIVLCDGCDLMAHASCYGEPFTSEGIPQGDWFCAQCLASKSDRNKQAMTCCLCPNSGGALKPTVGGEWAHLVCAIYVPEVYFEDPKGREGIDCSKVLRRRWEGKCYICGRKNNGCVIDCSEPKCGLGFHVSCGVKEELCIEYREGRSKGGVVAAFCKSHTDLWKKVID